MSTIKDTALITTGALVTGLEQVEKELPVKETKIISNIAYYTFRLLELKGAAEACKFIKQAINVYKQTMSGSKVVTHALSPDFGKVQNYALSRKGAAVFKKDFAVFALIALGIVGVASKFKLLPDRVQTLVSQGEKEFKKLKKVLSLVQVLVLTNSSLREKNPVLQKIKAVSAAISLINLASDLDQVQSHPKVKDSLRLVASLADFYRFLELAK